MYCIYSNKNPIGVQTGDAKEAWKILRSMELTDMPRIDVVIHIDDTDVSFSAATWYSVIYTGMDDVFDIPSEVIKEYVEAVDALKDNYPVERRPSELAVFGDRNLIFVKQTEKLDCGC